MTTKLPTLADFIPEDGDDLSAAIAALAALKVRGETARILTPAVLNFVVSLRRATVRQAECEAFAPAATDGAETVIRPATRKARKDAESIAEQVRAERADLRWSSLVAMPFRITRGGKIVTWGEATADEHEQKAASLECSAAGTLVTAERHRIAAKEIRDAGVRSLNDLYGRAAA